MLNRVLLGFGSVLGIAALVALGVFLHSRAEHNAYKNAYNQGHKDAYAEVERVQLRQALKDATLAATIRGNTDAQIGIVGRNTSAMLVHGPGKAVCPGNGITAASASGYNATGGATDAAVAGLLDAERRELIAVPFVGATAFAEQCDANRLEVIAWRTQHEQSGTPNGAH